jgi:hypothetical protein
MMHEKPSTKHLKAKKAEAPVLAYPSDPPITLADIDPARHERYSPNLHAWIDKHTRHLRSKERKRPWPKVLFEPEDAEEKRRPLIVWNDCSCHPSMYTGASIGAVLCFGIERNAPFGSFVIPDAVEWEGFWEEYLRIGRCVFDPKHSEFFSGAKKRFIEIGDDRTCAWCGASQRRERYEATVKKERWVMTTDPRWVATSES